MLVAEVPKVPTNGRCFSRAAGTMNTAWFDPSPQDNIFAVVLANMVNEVVWAYAVRLQFVWSIRQKRAYRSSGRRPKEA